MGQQHRLGRLVRPSRIGWQGSLGEVQGEFLLTHGLTDCLTHTISDLKPRLKSRNNKYVNHLIA